MCGWWQQLEVICITNRAKIMVTNSANIISDSWHRIILVRQLHLVISHCWLRIIWKTSHFTQFSFSFWYISKSALRARAGIFLSRMYVLAPMMLMFCLQWYVCSNLIILMFWPQWWLCSSPNDTYVKALENLMFWSQWYLYSSPIATYVVTSVMPIF